MGMSWILWIASILCCITIFRCDESMQKGPDPLTAEQQKAAELVLDAIFGFKPCLDETCSDGTESLKAAFDIAHQSNSKDGGYEIVTIPPENPPAELDKNMCAVMKPWAIKEFHEVVEFRHPGFSEVKGRIFNELVTYASAYSKFYAENCSVEMQFLDLIIVAAKALRKEYLKLPGGNCSYYFEEGYQWPIEPEVSCVSESTTVPASVVEGSTTPSPIYKKEHVTPSEEAKDSATVPAHSESGKPTEEVEEVIAEDEEYAPVVGSVRGIPGVHYPKYTDVPITSFSCADKHIPGFYADLETGCQVFHVCYEHRRESFLCPVGTTFNQPILACDYWYSSNCSLAPAYFEKSVVSEETSDDEEIHAVKDMISVIISETDGGTPMPEETVLEDIVKFLPVKATISEYPDTPKVPEGEKKPAVLDVENIASDIFDKMVITATAGASKTRDIIQKLPEPTDQEPKVKPVMKVPLVKAASKLAVAKAAVPIFAKAKIAAATLPVVAAKAAIPVAKVVAAKTAIPVAKVVAAKAAVPVAKVVAAKAAVPVAKVVAAKTAIPVAKVVAAKVAVPAAKVVAAPIIAKGKVAAAKVAVPVVTKAKVAAAVPVAAKVAAKASIPVLKTKMIASALPLAKTKLVAPAMKAKALKAATIPLAKGKVFAVPLAKSKIAAPVVKAKLLKAAAISPVTKKALALGYMKLLKAKKLALMG